MNKPMFAALLLSTVAIAANAQTTTPKPPKPCTAEQYHHFDFWIGNWEVKDATDKVVGHSEIKSILKGCALSEAWSSTSGYQGVSYNFYDRALNQWHQTWIGGQGGALYLNGSLVDGKMVLKGETPDKQGNISLQKITWTTMPDGRVNQHWQVSKDSGKSWQDSFLGYYSRK